MLSRWPHGFFTRRASGCPPAQLAVALALPAQTAFYLKQTHSAQIQPVPVEPGCTGDALWSDRPGDSIWVSTADCTPILLADPRTGAVAAIHAGWRGTAQSIVGATVAALCKQGSDPANLLCAMGPAISGSAYQVAHGVASEVTATITEASLALLPDAEPGRVRLDVREVNRQQAIARGLLPERIAICPACTYGSPDWLYSYRREGGGKIQYSGIGLPIEQGPGDDNR
ncbi:peptidoglycan editing factor PgeF [Gloeobacter kilaueensis]|uniref:Purine nucleoside phosphorylase n=1 Tax=Gloeobacter kilaueensis (strain ATCC BAA-2537 / CCAP 1431/1 / ULC 316 / JS1) TaxID=1183438 RepID=U5QJP3_GLOK1|nr:peptidoglycan editing factor PgeF [Gloeobacter kilaueensis]AGY57870.1 hypothetical protein GKIL_1624 [Gloeobacter kilaueensis JS1]